MHQQRDSNGRFATEAPETNSINLTVRVSASLKARIQAHAGKKYAEWVRVAIEEKLDREALDKPV